MKRATRVDLILILVFTPCIALVGLAGCHGRHPDDQTAIYQALSQHDLATVEVFQDRDRGVVTLKGIVGSPDRKSRAEQLAQQAAPGYTIQNQITVDNTGIMGMANPNATRPELEQVAPPANQSSDAATPATSKHAH